MDCFRLTEQGAPIIGEPTSEWEAIKPGNLIFARMRYQITEGIPQIQPEIDIQGQVIRLPCVLDGIAPGNVLCRMVVVGKIGNAVKAKLEIDNSPEIFVLAQNIERQACE